MKPRRLPPLVLSLALGVPALAQLPHFADGTAFGGSNIFSSGLNPLGNCSRFDKTEAGWYLSYLDGDQKGKDNASILKDLGSVNSVLATNALPKLKDAPWAVREKAFGVHNLVHGVSVSYTREESSSLLATPDMASSHNGSPSDLLLNSTSFALRAVKIDRIATGAGSGEQGTALGFLVRIEKISYGQSTAALNPSPDQMSLSDPNRLFDSIPMNSKRSTWGLDLGMTYELSQSWRMGVTINQLNSRRLWDVEEKTQSRLGLQIDMSSSIQLSVEQDLNRAERLPFAIKQAVTAASLRLTTGPSSAITFGAERRKMGDSVVTRTGATLLFHGRSYMIGLGFQYSEDRPLKGLALRVY